jgi:hypothetical protein
MRLAHLTVGSEYKVVDSEDNSTYYATFMGTIKLPHGLVGEFEVTNPNDSETLQNGSGVEFCQRDIDDGLLSISR